jgi:hypothetical protein
VPFKAGVPRDPVSNNPKENNNKNNKSVTLITPYSIL